jgi:pantoate--beta-alanine ligase
MKLTHRVKDCRLEISKFRQAGESVALVPTMGSLHAGHLALVQQARKIADRVVVTIFVNPSQFGDKKDLEKYPRDDEGDIKKLTEAGVDLLLLPSVEEVYPMGDETIVETTRMANMLHGLIRPGHFRGVTTVVARLFNFIQPDFACFGEKDYQQLQIIKRMVKDLAFPIEIIGVPTERASDGLALSSRNKRLSNEDRKAAPILNQALVAAENANPKTLNNVRQIIETTIAQEPRATLRGLDIVEAETLNEIENDTKTLSSLTAIMMSVQFSDILLIDQRVIKP